MRIGRDPSRESRPISETRAGPDSPLQPYVMYGARDNSVAPLPGHGSADYCVTVIVPVKLAYAAIDGG